MDESSFAGISGTSRKGAGETVGDIGSRLFSILFLVCLMAGLGATVFYNYLLFHSLAEEFCVVVGGGVFLLAWSGRRNIDSPFVLYVGIGYLFVAVLDQLHALSYQGIGIFQRDVPNLPTQLWISARFIESFSLFVGAWMTARTPRAVLVLAVNLLLVFFLLLSIFVWRIFPVCWEAGIGLTPFKKVSEFVIAGVLVVAIVSLFQQRDRFTSLTFNLLVASYALTIVAELTFTLYDSVFGPANLIGHLLKVLSFYLLYRAVIHIGLSTPLELLFRDLKRRETVLAEREKHYARAERLGGFGHWSLNLEAASLTWSQGAYKLFGVSPERFRPTLEGLLAGVHPDDRSRVEDFFNDVSPVKQFRELEYRIIRPDGIERLLRCVAETDFELETGAPILSGTLQDVTERQAALEALRESERRYMELSITDDLTRLFNIRHFWTQLDAEIARAVRYERPLSLLMMDIDDFKLYNDSYGHPEGDKVLATIGKVIRRCLRSMDTAYRYGGEEFAVILPETEGREAVRVANRIVRAFRAETFSPDIGLVIHKTVSIGVARHKPPQDSDEFVKQADRALYLAKHRGKNRVEFPGGSQQRGLRRPGKHLDAVE